MEVEKDNGVLGRYESLKLTAVQIFAFHCNSLRVKISLHILVAYLSRCFVGCETCQVI